MSVDNSQVAHLWANGVDKKYSRQNVFAENRTIFSYGRHFPMARFYGPSVVLFTRHGYSVSTSRHLSYVRRALHGHAVKVFTVDKVSTLYGEALTKAEHRKNLEDYLRRAADLVAQSKRPRLRQTTRDYLLGQAAGLIAESNEYRAAFKLGGRPVANVDKAAELMARAAANEAQREKRAADKARRENRERFEKWLAGEVTETFGLSDFPVSFRLKPGSKGRIVESSLGAEFTAAVARLAYPRLCAVRDTLAGDSVADLPAGDGALMVGAFRVSSVSRAFVVAGCHRVPWSSVESLAVLLGV